MGKGKGKCNRDLLNAHRGVNHMPYKKNPQKGGSLADQIREKILGETVENLSTSPEYAVDMLSKVFDGVKIRLKHIKKFGYTAADVRGFFSALDYVDRIYVVVDNLHNPFVTLSSLFVVKLGTKKHSIPVELFWMALPSDIREKFKHSGSFLVTYNKMFSQYGRKLVPTTSS